MTIVHEIKQHRSILTAILYLAKKENPNFHGWDENGIKMNTGCSILSNLKVRFTIAIKIKIC